MPKHSSRASVSTQSAGEPIYVLDEDGGTATITGDQRTLDAVRDSLVKDGAVEKTVYDYGYLE
jgi:hypothetical protein